MRRPPSARSTEPGGHTTTRSSHTEKLAGRVGGPYIPPDKNVTGFLASEVIIVLQDYLISVPHYHSKLVSGGEEGRQGMSLKGEWVRLPNAGNRLPIKHRHTSSLQGLREQLSRWKGATLLWPGLLHS